jgi:Mu-like prophage protein gp46
MSDVRIINVTNLEGIWADWLLKPDATLDETEELVNIVKMALLTYALADVDDILPNPDSTDRCGWWGDFEAETIWDGWPIGAKLWLLKRSKITPAEAKEGSTLARAEQYCRVALQPLIERRICTRIDIEVTRASIERIHVLVTIYRGEERKIELRFQNLWDEITVRGD